MRNRGFTLVEILIVVVILGILAAIVVPQFTSASNEAVKGALQSQLQTITSQVELYRVREQGTMPDLGNAAFVDSDGNANDGWGALVDEQYLKEVPFNGYTGSGVIAAADGTGLTSALGDDRDSANGWYWDATDTEVFAAGYEPDTNLLAHEDGFDAGG